MWMMSDSKKEQKIKGAMIDIKYMGMGQCINKSNLYTVCFKSLHQISKIHFYLIKDTMVGWSKICS